MNLTTQQKDTIHEKLFGIEGLMQEYRKFVFWLTLGNHQSTRTPTIAETQQAIREVGAAIQTAGTQLFSNGHLRDTLTVTKKCQEQAKQIGLTEADVKAVYNQGSVSPYNNHCIEKDYNGYSLSIFSFRDHRTGQPVISSIRKKY